MASRRVKILVAKLGLDGHDRGALVLCRAFRDAGMEVIYSGLFATPDRIAQIAEAGTTVRPNPRWRKAGRCQSG